MKKKSKTLKFDVTPEVEQKLAWMQTECGKRLGQPAPVGLDELLRFSLATYEWLLENCDEDGVVQVMQADGGDTVARVSVVGVKPARAV